MSPQTLPAMVNAKSLLGPNIEGKEVKVYSTQAIVDVVQQEAKVVVDLETSTGRAEVEGAQSDGVFRLDLKL